MSVPAEVKVNEHDRSIIDLWAAVNIMRLGGGGIALSSGVLRKKGSATILTGTTSIAVTHGAGITPVVQDIYVIPNNNPTNDPGIFWIDTITSTQFTINCRANPGASGWTFGWTVLLA